MGTLWRHEILLLQNLSLCRRLSDVGLYTMPLIVSFTIKQKATFAVAFAYE